MSMANTMNSQYVGEHGVAGMGVACDPQTVAEAMKMAQQSGYQAPLRPSLERELDNLHQSVTVLEGELDMFISCLWPISESAPPQVSADGSSEILPEHLGRVRAAHSRIQAMIRQVMEARGRLAL